MASRVQRLGLSWPGCFSGRAIATVFVVPFIAASVSGDENVASEEETAILQLVLKQACTTNGYTVVAPYTDSSSLLDEDPEDLKVIKSGMTESFAAAGFDVAGLVERLYSRNISPVRLTLPSSPDDGYLIDYSGEYKKYFEGGGGWEKWYEDHPEAHGHTQVSLPVFDHDSGLVLVYTGTQSHWLSGTGWIILYRYANGSLEELQREMLWIS